jgi:uncharacterized protein YndB with AHSA1/START domain
MKKEILFDFTVDKENKKIYVKRSFDANLPMVWQAWTDDSILDQWWAPLPWTSKTIKMDFRNGGRWFYTMNSPDGKEKHYCLMNYKTIVPQKSIISDDAFADEKGNVRADFPPNHWETKFNPNGEETLVNITLTFDKLEHLEQMIQMGFKEGFTQGLDQLDALLNRQKTK